MKFYNRQLKSLDDLQRERRKLSFILNADDKLKSKRRQNTPKQSLSAAEATTEKEQDFDWLSLLSSATDLLLKPGLANLAISTLLGSKKSGRSILKSSLAQATGDKLWAVSKTVLGGYIKWTALSLGTKLLSYLVKDKGSDKDKK